MVKGARLPRLQTKRIELIPNKAGQRPALTIQLTRESRE